MGLDNDVCLKCKRVMLIDTSEMKHMRPFCPDCEREMNKLMEKGFKKKGRNTKGKALVYPKRPPSE